MADKPIIFSAPMVNALLAGRKTQTRRIIENVPDAPPSRCAPRNTPRHPAPYLDAYCEERPTPTNPRGMGRNWHWWQIDDRPGPVVFRLRYAPGDRLWVREAFSYETLDVDRNGFMPPWYWADGNPMSGDFTRPKSPIHMPRWASRLTLTVTDVRVQRLHDISEEDAIAEGVEPLHTGYFPYGITTFLTTFVGDREVPAQCCRTAKHSYEMLWNSLHGPGAWEANPWVAAYSFTVQRGNIDTQGGPQ